MMRPLLAVLAALGVGCSAIPEEHTEGVTVTPDTGLEADPVLLRDADGADVESSLEVEEVEVAAGVDVLLDWSGLSEDRWGRPLDPIADAQRAALYHFTIADLDTLLDGLVHQTLSQSSLDIQVSCLSETASCHLSEFSFMLGHEIDVVDRFQEGDGIWLLAVQATDGSEDLAYLVLVPVQDCTTEQAEVTDTSSEQTLATDMHAMPVVTVERDGEMLVDWADLTTDTLGDDFDPRLIDRITVARVPDEALDDPGRVLVQLREVALELWFGRVPNSAASFPLAELVDPITGEQGFQGPEGPDTWLLMLGCSTCGDPLPRFVSELAWAEGL